MFSNLTNIADTDQSLLDAEKAELIKLINNPHLIPSNELDGFSTRFEAAGFDERTVDYATVVAEVQTRSRSFPSVGAPFSVGF